MDKAEPPFILDFPPKYWEIEVVPEIKPTKSKKHKSETQNDNSSGPCISVKGDVIKFRPYQGLKAMNSFRYSPKQGMFFD